MTELQKNNILVGKSLRKTRKKLGLSQQDISAILNVRHQQIQKYEDGTNRLSGASAVTLANNLDIDVGVLLGADRKRKKKPGNTDPNIVLDDAIRNAVEVVKSAQIVVSTLLAAKSTK